LEWGRPGKRFKGNGLQGRGDIHLLTKGSGLVHHVENMNHRKALLKKGEVMGSVLSRFFALTT